MIWTSSSAAAAFFAVDNFFYMVLLLLFPPLMAFIFAGYLRPAHGKAKMSMLGPSVIVGLFFVIISDLVSLNTDILGNLIFFTGWGIGSSILVAGSLANMQTFEQSTTPGILDVSSLHYGPVKEEPEPEPIAEETSTPETASEPTAEEISQPETEESEGKSEQD